MRKYYKLMTTILFVQILFSVAFASAPDSLAKRHPSTYIIDVGTDLNMNNTPFTVATGSQAYKRFHSIEENETYNSTYNVVVKKTDDSICVLFTDNKEEKVYECIFLIKSVGGRNDGM